MYIYIYIYIYIPFPFQGFYTSSLPPFSLLLCVGSSAGEAVKKTEAEVFSNA